MYTQNCRSRRVLTTTPFRSLCVVLTRVLMFFTAPSRLVFERSSYRICFRTTSPPNRSGHETRMCLTVADNAIEMYGQTTTSTTIAIIVSTRVERLDRYLKIDFYYSSAWSDDCGRNGKTKIKYSNGKKPTRTGIDVTTWIIKRTRDVIINSWLVLIYVDVISFYRVRLVWPQRIAATLGRSEYYCWLVLSEIIRVVERKHSFLEHIKYSFSSLKPQFFDRRNSCEDIHRYLLDFSENLVPR